MSLKAAKDATIATLAVTFVMIGCFALAGLGIYLIGYLKGVPGGKFIAVAIPIVVILMIGWYGFYNMAKAGEKRVEELKKLRKSRPKWVQMKDLNL